MQVRAVVTKEDFGPIAEYPKPPGGYRYLCLLQLSFPKVLGLGWMPRVCLRSSHLHFRGCWHVLYTARFHLYGSALSWQSALKHLSQAQFSLYGKAVACKWFAPLMDSLQWFREVVTAEHFLCVHYGVTSPQTFAIWICHYLFSQCKYFRAVTSSRKKKEGNCFCLNCVEGDNFHTLSLSII